MIFFAKELSYTKNDIESLTTREMNSILKGKFLSYYNTKTHYEDMAKYANLGAWIINALGGDIDDIEKLIGEYPRLDLMTEDNKRELTEEDLNWIEFAKANNMEYKVTSTGIKLG